MTPGGATGEEKNQTQGELGPDGWFDWLSVLPTAFISMVLSRLCPLFKE